MPEISQLTVTFINPTPAVLDFLRGIEPAREYASSAPAPEPAWEPTSECASSAPAREPLPPLHDAQGTLVRTHTDLEELCEGDRAHWAGAKFTFHGTVEEVLESPVGDDLAVRVRRDDSDKVVRLTYNDLQTGVLMRSY